MIIQLKVEERVCFIVLFPTYRLKLEFYVDCVGQFVSMIIWLGWQATLVALFGQVGVEYIHCLLINCITYMVIWLSNCSVPKRKKTCSQPKVLVQEVSS